MQLHPSCTVTSTSNLWRDKTKRKETRSACWENANCCASETVSIRMNRAKDGVGAFVLHSCIEAIYIITQLRERCAALSEHYFTFTYYF